MRLWPRPRPIPLARPKPARFLRVRFNRNREGRFMTANTVTLNWTDPTELSDDTPLPVGSVAAVFDSGSPTPSVAIGSVPVGTQTFITAVLSPGPHNFTVVITDLAGVSSVPSNVASVTVQPPVDVSPPKPATGLTATLNTN